MKSYHKPKRFARRFGGRFNINVAWQRLEVGVSVLFALFQIRAKIEIKGRSTLEERA